MVYYYYYLFFFLIILLIVKMMCKRKRIEKENFPESYYIKVGNKWLGKNEHLTISQNEAIEVVKNKTFQKLIIHQVNSRFAQSLYLKHIIDKDGMPEFKFREYEIKDKKYYLFDYKQVEGKDNTYLLKNEDAFVSIMNNKLHGTRDRNLASKFEFVKKT